MSIESLERRLSQLPSPDEGLEECPFIPSQRLDLISELESRPLGPSGRRLLHFLLNGEGQTQEIVALLRKVCSKIKQQVWSPKDGFMIEQGHLDADEIIESMPRELAEDRQYEEALKIGLLSGPPAGADSPLPFESVPGEVEEDI